MRDAAPLSHDLKLFRAGLLTTAMPTQTSAATSVKHPIAKRPRAELFSQI